MLNHMIEIKIKLQEYISNRIILLIIGFNSFKNHIYSYFDKEQQKGKENEK